MDQQALAFKLQNVPKLPGVYLWKNKHGEIIYIGKAKNLYNRTHQYFNAKGNNYKTNVLVSHIADLDFIVTKTENDSLMLEANLINQHRPKYNILLKERFNYPYIVITNEKDPRLLYTRNYRSYKGKYYGPFAASNFNKFDIYTLLNHLFPLRKCYKLPKKRCLYYDIGECLGPCIKNVEQNKYDEIRKQIDDFFNGKTKSIIKMLEEKEKRASEKFDFEMAKKYYELIQNINYINKNDPSNVFIGAKEKIDVVGWYTHEQYLALIIHTYINGKLLTVNKLINEYYDNLDELIVSCLNDYYLHNFNLPQQVYLPLEQKYLSDLNYQNKIKFINPKAGKFISIIKLANTNAEQYFKSDYLVYKRQKALNEDAFEQLKQLLGIDNLNLINVFDMSNLFGTEKVGGMIALSNGEFNKKLYRKFIIKDANNVGDTQAMNEVVSRQYKRTLSERQSLPNLIIVDGGINQVNATIKALQTIKLDQIIPVIGLYKDRNHKTDGIIYREQKIALDHKSGLYLYLFNIQEEVHRFAISFFRQRKHRLN